MSELKGCFYVDLADLDAAGGIVSEENPEEERLIITNVVLDVTTVATAACTVNAGIAADGSTSADNLLDGVDVNSATGVFDSATNKGSNGKTVKSWGATEYLTVSKATGAADGLVGRLYVHYIRAN